MDKKHPQTSPRGPLILQFSSNGISSPASDFMTDIITVETSDHARLSLKVSYNWAFSQRASSGRLCTTEMYRSDLDLAIQANSCGLKPF